MPKSESVNKEKRRKINDFATEFVARATGLEPVTYGLTVGSKRVKNDMLKTVVSHSQSGL